MSSKSRIDSPTIEIIGNDITRLGVSIDLCGKLGIRHTQVDDIRPGYRRSVCGVDSIYYRIEGDTVEIMAILGQQDIDTWL